jgi:hypothetical protein
MDDILQNGTGYASLMSARTQRVSDKYIYLRSDKSLSVKSPYDYDPSVLWGFVKDSSDGQYWIVSAYTQALPEYMMYLNDPEASYVNFWPVWRDPNTKWKIIPNKAGQFWIVSGPG